MPRGVYPQNTICRGLSLNCRSGASFPAPVPPPSHAHPTASQCTVEVYAGVAAHLATRLR
ncbi:hypothetical protein BT67DRAFT_445814, partial [Trichocladium antarcticum]